MNSVHRCRSCGARPSWPCDRVPAAEGERQRLENQLEEFDRLNALITQILTLARAEAGQIALARTSVNLAAVTTTVVDQLEPVAEARQVILISGNSSGPVSVTGDAGWLERLLLVLLDNAIKFTPRGGRVHRAPRPRSRRGDADRAGSPASASISSRDALPHVFERFYRADPARSRETEGAGLGLALARWVAIQHRGTIDVASRSGQGSRFTLSLPTT